jgi:hypothetical protein
VVFQTTTGPDHVLDEVVMRNRNDGWYVASVAAPDGGRWGWSPCIKWCVDYYGWRMNGWRIVGEGVFEFHEEKHAAWFLMRWS